MYASQPVGRFSKGKEYIAMRDDNSDWQQQDHEAQQFIEENKMKVYRAINEVQKELASSGISKQSENKFDGYKFRGIDAVYNAISPLLGKHGLCILPRMISRTCEERVSQKGGALFYVTVDAEFDFISSEDGSKHTVKVFGEAMDRGDKATNKAMSAAYKYAAFLSFAIPTEGDNDADTSSHEVKSKITPTSGAWEAMDEASQVWLETIAEAVHAWLKTDSIADALAEIDAAKLNVEQKTALWTRFDSKERAAIKKYSNEVRAK